MVSQTGITEGNLELTNEKIGKNQLRTETSSSSSHHFSNTSLNTDLDKLAPSSHGPTVAAWVIQA